MQNQKKPRGSIAESVTRLIAATLGIFFAVSPLSSGAATVEEWRSDLDAIVVDVRAIHPDPFARVGKLEFMRQAEALKSDLPRLTEEQRVVRAMRLIALIGDTHTQLEPSRPDFALWYPVRIYEFSDGYFVTAAHRSVAELAGAQVLEAAGQPIDRVANDARSLMGADNAFASKEYVFAFSNAALMKGLGYASADGSLKIKCKLADGRIVERTLSPHRSDDARYDKDDSTFEWHFQPEMGGPPFGGVDAWISAYKGLPYAAFRTTDVSRPPRLMNRRGFSSRYLPEQDAFYLQSNFVGQNLEQEFREALQQVDKLRPRRLILDFRYNFGGDGSHVPAMLREFIKRGDAPPWKELYILTGRRTLSAGIMAVVALLENTDHTAIGEPMSAPINSYGDPRSIPFAKTGLRMNLSTVSHQLGDPEDIRPFAPVDVPAPFSFADYAVGRDPAVDPILRGEEMRSLQVIALADGGAAARRVWEQRKLAYSKYDGWSPPTEIVLRRAAQTLLEQKRVGDAVETAGLNADIHPEEWRVWYNLAKAQAAAGQKTESLASYRRVLEIDPNNFNLHEIRKLFEDAGVPLNLQ
jgi:tetratricopeptide (TPR) repeat protein